MVKWFSNEFRLKIVREIYTKISLKRVKTKMLA